MTQISNIAILGAGLMGHGIAQVFLTRPGYEVAIFDPVVSMLDTVRERINSNLRFLGEPACDLSRLRLTTSMHEAVRNAHIIFEAAPEKIELKHQIFCYLESIATATCILRINKKVIPISTIGEKLASRGQLVGTHWWNPPYLIPLVEVIATRETRPEVVSLCMKLLDAVGKVPVRVKKDVPGFVGNRLQHALWREAIALVEAGVCDAETVDLVVKNSFGLRLPVLGPLENADLVGLDLTQDIHRVLLPHLSRSSDPSPLLSELMADGKLGMKSGKGFYDWSPASSAELRKQLLEHLVKLLSTKGKVPPVM